jgi:hypothetical protein
VSLEQVQVPVSVGRVKAWRREAVQRLICEMKDLTQNCTATA